MKVFLFVILTKKLQKPSVKGTLRYQKINFFTTSAFPILILLLFTFHFSLLALCGCGYTIHGRASLPFDSVQIGNIENRTFEPKLQDKLHRALTEEFLKQGITVQPYAGYTLSGTIHQFQLNVLSTKDDIAVEYEALIKADFRLVEPSGKVKEFKNIGSPFIVSFSSSGKLSDVIALKELASEKAIKDMAMEIIAVIMYR
ncbi:MAG: LPS assembly lipoprotein LptE [Nitrospirota bacterium]|nr:LPS assembly lipoprotein LptE [Nitrospirota bacterium]